MTNALPQLPPGLRRIPAVAVADTTHTAVAVDAQPLGQQGAQQIASSQVPASYDLNSLRDLAGATDPTAQDGEEPPHKKQRQGGQNNQHRHNTGRESCQAAGSSYLQTPHFCVRPNVSGLPKLVSLFSGAVQHCIPKQIGLENFKKILLSVVLYNLYHKVDRWTSALRLGQEVLPVTYANIPIPLAKAIDYMQPCKEDDCQVPLFPHFADVTEQIRNMARVLVIPVPFEDLSLVNQWETVRSSIVKVIGRDIFVSSTNARSLLRCAVLRDDATPEMIDVMQIGAAAGPQPLVANPNVKYFVASPRQLIRAEELTLSLLRPRICQQREQNGDRWYVPHRDPAESRGLSPLLTNYWCGARSSGSVDYERELLRPLLADAGW